MLWIKEEKGPPRLLWARSPEPSLRGGAGRTSAPGKGGLHLWRQRREATSSESWRTCMTLIPAPLENVENFQIKNGTVLTKCKPQHIFAVTEWQNNNWQALFMGFLNARTEFKSCGKKLSQRFMGCVAVKGCILTCEIESMTEKNVFFAKLFWSGVENIIIHSFKIRQ